MRHRLERILKHLLSLLLRFVTGSRPVALTPDVLFHRILVIRQHNQLGDMLCVVPLLRALRMKFPDAYIVLMASPINHDIMLNNRYIDKVIKYDKREFLNRGVKGMANLFSFARMLADEKFDMVIVPSTVSLSFTSDVFAYLTGARVRIGAAGLDGKRNRSAFLLTNPVWLDWTDMPHRHQTLRNLDVAKELHLQSTDLSLEVTFDKNELDAINALNSKQLAKKQLTIVYHPGAGKAANKWDAWKFAEVANALSQEFGSSALITSGPMDEDAVSQMVSQMTVPCTVVKNKTIREVASILSTVCLVVTNDTGIMHVAGAVGVPVLSLFGPTDPEQWAPLGPGNRFIRGNGGDINAITVEEVLQNARAMLARYDDKKSGLSPE